MAIAKIKTSFTKRVNKMTQSKAVKKKTDDEVLPQAMLIDALQKYYGIEFNGDKIKFIRDLTKESHRIAKERSNHDPRKLAEMEEKIAKLRFEWADDLAEDPETDEQKDLRQELEDKGYAVSITFPDDETYQINVGGQEDSGSMSAGKAAIIGVVERMVNPQGY